MSNVNVFYVIPKKHFWPVFFQGDKIGDVYLRKWLLDKLIANEHEHFLFNKTTSVEAHFAGIFLYI